MASVTDSVAAPLAATHGGPDGSPAQAPADVLRRPLHAEQVVPGVASRSRRPDKETY